jgi:hypothetical protein
MSTHGERLIINAPQSKLRGAGFFARRSRLVTGKPILLSISVESMFGVRRFCNGKPLGMRYIGARPFPGPSTERTGLSTII